MPSRISREMRPAKYNPSAIVGNTICRGDSHNPAGSHFHWKAKTMISSGPTTNAGMQMATHQIAQIAQILFPKRLVQMVLCLEGSLNFWGSRLTLLVERTSRRDAH